MPWSQVSPFLPIRWFACPWLREHVDLAGPYVHGSHLPILLIDGYSKWMEVHTFLSATSTGTTTCLCKIFATFELPEVFVSDNARNFIGVMFETFLKQNAWYPTQALHLLHSTL